MLHYSIKTLTGFSSTVRERKSCETHFLSILIAFLFLCWILNRYVHIKSNDFQISQIFSVRPQTSSCMYHFLQTSLVHVYSSVQSLLGLQWTQRSRVRVLALARIFYVHFFRHCATISIFPALCYFFSNFFCLQKVPPSSFFDILQQKPKASPLLCISALCDSSNFSFFVFFGK